MKIPILVYHGLSKSKAANRYTLEEHEFQTQIEYLHKNDYQTISIKDYYLSLLDSKIRIPAKSVMITFDDGHESDFTIALPILRKFNFKANIFATTDWIGKNGYMNPSQLRSLKEEGMSVQSHAKTHRFLDELQISEINMELDESRKRLEDILGVEVSFLAFPGGRYNKKTIECAKRLRFSALFSSVPFSLGQFDQTFVIGRYNIKHSLGREIYFKNFISSNFFKRSVFQGGYYGKYITKKILGRHLYYFAWKKYIGKA